MFRVAVPTLRDHADNNAVPADTVRTEMARGAGEFRRWWAALKLKDGELTPFELAVAGGPAECGSGGGRGGSGS